MVEDDREFFAVAVPSINLIRMGSLGQYKYWRGVEEGFKTSKHGRQVPDTKINRRYIFTHPRTRYMK